MHFWALTKYSKLLTFFKRENFSTSKVLIYDIDRREEHTLECHIDGRVPNKFQGSDDFQGH